MRFSKAEQGFTFVELAVVMVAAGLLLAVGAGPAHSLWRARERALVKAEATALARCAKSRLATGLARSPEEALAACPVPARRAAELSGAAGPLTLRDSGRNMGDPERLGAEQLKLEGFEALVVYFDRREAVASPGELDVSRAVYAAVGRFEVQSAAGVRP